ncbi:L-serine ammonia-lyase, iron-sulfur-dependent subunit beta [Paenibacillus daejeonensis]|uniref:L-serine ammonia-lyase, iron-sulfur-dependent subunit beta n=1 Tax=Paenibacillus daejeonensis TaxID=135193 RepID=UPI00036D5EC1|nr:L-serine ammonia-lyase, iron-sulfur-dependent subunit beta [Paenibacillus daejeonensis]
MRFRDVFSIIGPSMIGPSSSHTAGAARLGRTARAIVGETPEQAEIELFGSFADTYEGHGTDLALVAGLLGYIPSDTRIRDSLSIAEQEGMAVTFKTGHKPVAHPNTVRMRLRNGGREHVVTGCSIGGGNIEITGVNGFDVKFTAGYPTILVFHGDRPGMLADMTDLYRDAGLNIGYMEVDRKSRSGDVLTVIESDGMLPDGSVQLLSRLVGVQRVSRIDPSEVEGSG